MKGYCSDAPHSVISVARTQCSHPGTYRQNVSLLFLGTITVCILLATPLAKTYGQVVPITPSGLNTQVSDPIAVGGQTQYDITGGTRPGGGGNLFHSFGEFGVPTNNIANFLNETGLPTSNILGRVTGGNVSNIFGTIQTTGFGNANLFLMNPTGFLFGPNATLNVGGMVAFTTADYLKLTDNARFNAIPNAAADALLTALPVASFGFLGSNPGAITVQGSQFTVTQGTGISLVGGNITVQSAMLDDGTTVQPARLSAPGGQINLASVASPGEVFHSSLQTGPNINGQSFTSRGSITLSGGSTVDVSANAAGTVRILGGQFVMDKATISADTVNANGAPVAIDINVTGGMSVIAIDVPALTARTTGSGDAGEIRISSGNIGMSATTFDNFLFPIIDTHTSGSGRAGNVTITTGDLAVTGDPSGLALFIDSGTAGQGRLGLGGDVRLNALSVQMQDTYISTGNFVASVFGEGATGAAGNVTISADSIQLVSSAIDTSNLLLLPSFADRPGDISVTARAILIDGPGSGIFTDTQGIGAGGNIFVNANSFTLQNGGTLSAKTSSTEATATGGTITVNAYQVNTDGATITVETTGAGQAGSIALITQPMADLTADAINLNNSLITSSTTSNANAGDVLLQTGALRIENSQVSSDALPLEGFTGGNAGTIDAQVGGNIILTNSVISTATSGDGNAGNILMAGNSLQAETTLLSSIAAALPGLSGGDGGTIQLNIAQNAHLSNSTIDSQTVANGNAGNVFVDAASLTLNSSNLSTGTSPGEGFTGGNAGDIQVTVGQLTMNDGLIVSQSLFSAGNGGMVTVTASESITTSGSGNVAFFAISTSTEGAASFCPGTCGNGGSITLMAPTVIFNGVGLNSTTTGQGNAGNILAKVGTLTVMNGAQISASAENPVVVTGAGGAVTIQGLASPAQSVLIDGPGSGIFTDTQGTGAGGNILIETSQSTTLTNGAAISALSTGTMDNAGDAGMVTIHAGNTFFMQDSSVTTQATKSGGGQIEINAANLFWLVNSTVSSSVLNGTGGGGNIMIDPNVVVLQNSKILARAIQGAGGNITIFTPLFLADSSSLVSASSQFGLNGTVTIQSPTSNLSGSVGTLPSNPSQAQSLLTQRCAALANGQASSFVVAGREQLPSDPGGWLTSPITLAGLDTDPVNNETVAKGTSNLEPRTSSLSANGMVSLRRLTPAGFLMANFADSEATGCHS